MSTNNFDVKPFGNQVIIQPILEEISSSGIIKPITSETKPVQGKVIAVGSGTPEKPLTVTVGTIVIFRKYAGTEFERDGQSYLVLREDDLIGEITQ